MGSSNRISAVGDASFGESRTSDDWPNLGAGAQARYGQTQQDYDAFAQDDHTVAVLAVPFQCCMIHSWHCCCCTATLLRTGPGGSSS